MQVTMWGVMPADAPSLIADAPLTPASAAAPGKPCQSGLNQRTLAAIETACLNFYTQNGRPGATLYLGAEEVAAFSILSITNTSDNVWLTGIKNRLDSAKLTFRGLKIVETKLQTHTAVA